MIETFLQPKLNQFLEEAEIWFQQVRATAHTSRRLLGILRELFSGRLSLRGDITWSPREGPGDVAPLDLSLCDFFLSLYT
ncbi:DUF4817 domain-containing protein [Trichonephila clavata]|uniref:DUF4817 domain-containing protein n=1 Tax=Trichonephila clavata TaxID=2740835 RepID=A0A8X6LR96_TRICU|nr:DUF4817 domain-containing protein [Trichonephila clavata]